MLQHLLPRVPVHKAYVEPFFGGGALFFAKPPSEVEIVNDLNNEVVNFYRTLQQRRTKLYHLVREALHSRKMFDHACFVRSNPEHFSSLKRAWAFWMCCTLGFGSKVDGTFGYGKADTTVSKKLMNKKQLFTEELENRVQLLQIECTDALRVIASRDTLETFFYLDPPYFNSDCGHYKGYSITDFEDLLKACTGLQGKFLLSSYDSEILQEFTTKHGWHQIKIEQPLSVTGKAGKGRRKVEVLTANYPI